MLFGRASWYITNDLRDVVGLKNPLDPNKQYKTGNRVMDDLFYSPQGLGIITDLLEAYSGNWEKKARFLGGPTASKGVELLKAYSYAQSSPWSDDRYELFHKFAVSLIPGMGRTLKAALYPKEDNEIEEFKRQLRKDSGLSDIREELKQIRKIKKH